MRLITTLNWLKTLMLLGLGVRFRFNTGAIRGRELSKHLASLGFKVSAGSQSQHGAQRNGKKVGGKLGEYLTSLGFSLHNFADSHGGVRRKMVKCTAENC